MKNLIFMSNRILKVNLLLALTLLSLACGRIPGSRLASGAGEQKAPSDFQNEVKFNPQDGTLTYQNPNGSKTNETDIDDVSTSTQFIGFTHKNGGGAIVGTDGTSIINDPKVSKVRVSDTAAGYMSQDGGGAILATNGKPIVDFSPDIVEIQISNACVGYLNKNLGGTILCLKNNKWIVFINDPSITAIYISKYFFGYLANNHKGRLFSIDQKQIPTEQPLTNIWITDNFLAYRTTDSKYFLRSAKKEFFNKISLIQLAVTNNHAGYIDEAGTAHVVTSEGREIFSNSNVDAINLSDTFYSYYSHEEGIGALKTLSGTKLAELHHIRSISVSDLFFSYIDDKNRGAIYRRDGTVLKNIENVKAIDVSQYYAAYLTPQGDGFIWARDSKDPLYSGNKWASVHVSDEFAGYTTDQGDAFTYDHAGHQRLTSHKVEKMVIAKNFIAFLSNKQELSIFSVNGRQIKTQTAVQDFLIGEHFLIYLSTYKNTLHSLNIAGVDTLEAHNVTFYQIKGDDLSIQQNAGPEGSKVVGTRKNLASGHSVSAG
jgi:hypothetical protein